LKIIQISSSKHEIKGMKGQRTRAKSDRGRVSTCPLEWKPIQWPAILGAHRAYACRVAKVDDILV